MFKHHSDWLKYLAISGAVAAPFIGEVTAAAAKAGPNPFVDPAFDIALFNDFVAAISQVKKAITAESGNADDQTTTEA
jgi:hypothetical protein